MFDADNGVFPGLWISYLMQLNGKESPERLTIDPIWFNAEGWIETNAPTIGTQMVEQSVTASNS